MSAEDTEGLPWDDVETSDEGESCPVRPIKLSTSKRPIRIRPIVLRTTSKRPKPMSMPPRSAIRSVRVAFLRLHGDTEENQRKYQLANYLVRGDEKGTLGFKAVTEWKNGLNADRAALLTPEKEAQLKEMWHDAEEFYFEERAKEMKAHLDTLLL